MRSDGLQQEALACAIATHEKAEARAALGDEPQIGKEGLNLNLATHGDVGQADARDDAALEGVEDHGGHALGDAQGGLRIEGW